MNWYFEVLRKYAVFEGRAHRTEYWMFALFNFLIGIGLALLGAAATGLAWIYWIYALAIVIPNLAVGCRRLHDTGRSGWWQLISLIPIIGFIVLLIFFVTDSQLGSNQYGPNPWGKGEAAKTTDQRLRELDSLRMRALISEEEYQEKRQEILDEL